MIQRIIATTKITQKRYRVLKHCRKNKFILKNYTKKVKMDTCFKKRQFNLPHCLKYRFKLLVSFCLSLL